MNITVMGNPEPEAFASVCRRLAIWGVVYRAEIHCIPRTKEGWLEYLLTLYREEGSRIITIGMIQRTEGAAFEFHS